MLLSGILFFCAAAARGQRENNIWVFGSGAGLDFNAPGNPLPFTSAINQWEGSAAVADAVSGQLLFYTDGNTVWNAGHQVMPGGAIGVATNSTTQAALILPFPGIAGRYYVFSLGELSAGVNPDMGRLYYSVVDMSLGGGLGDIVAGQKKILLDTGLTEAQAGVIITDADCNADTWLITHTRTGDTFRVRRITASGIGAPVLSAAGTPGADIRGGIIRMSPSGRKLTFHHQQAAGGSGPSLTLFDFDPGTGIVSNPVPVSTRNIYGACFSPDNEKLYAVTQGLNGRLYQYDLSSGVAAVIQASEVDLGAVTGGFQGRNDIQLGPDGKIYLGAEYAGRLHRVNAPNLAGAACNYTLNAVALAPGTSKQLGMPNITVRIKRSGTDTLYRMHTLLCRGLLTATDTSGHDYRWDDGFTGPQRQVSRAGVYRVAYYTGIPPCLSYYVDSFVVKGISPELYLLPACKGTASGLARVTPEAGDTSGYAYAWRQAGDTMVVSVSDSLSDIAAGTYHLHITTTAGCDTTLTFYLPEADDSITFDADTLVCTGDTVLFVHTSGPLFHAWRWYFGDGDTSALEHPAHTYDRSGRFQVMLTGESGRCADTAYRTITVDAPVAGPDFTADRDSLCVGETVILTPRFPAADHTLAGLYWRFGEDEGPATVSAEAVRYHADKAGMIVITLTARFRACPEVSRSDTIRVYPYPLVNLGPDTAICPQGMPLVLRNLHENGPGDYRYQWNTGSTEQTLTVTQPGSYTLSLSNSHGCTTTDEVNVDRDCYMDIPNVFTPDGDGVNDYFFPRQMLSGGITAFSCSIFNRWGQLVFTTKSPDGRGWDGSLNGRPQPAGVFAYLIEVAFRDGRREKYQGNVTLLR